MRIEDRIKSRVGVLAGAALLTATLASCDFIEPTQVNPNAVPDATLDQLFTGIQVNTIFFSEGQLSRLSAVWTQQMTGTDRQFQGFDQYVIDESTADAAFNTIYTGGGLIDMNRAVSLAEEDGRRVYAGILKVYEAYVFGMAASVWGDIPYSEAANPEITEPALDEQAAVYASVQSLLDDAIADLQSGEGAGPGSTDMSFGGDAEAWLDVAHTLKARLHLHWVEAEGDSRYQQALTAAQNGILTADHNWTFPHAEGEAQENNFWNQFTRERSGYISSGVTLLPMMREKDDDRIGLYFTGPPFNAPGEGGATSIIDVEDGVGAAGASFLVMSCAENNFIIAEAQHQLGNESAAEDAALDAIACQEAYYGVTLDDQEARIEAASGQALFEEIMEQKYAAQFLNIDAWNDYKRTCLPAEIEPRVEGKQIPGRVFYSGTERTTNPNIPAPAEQPLRNDNDPNACS